MGKKSASAPAPDPNIGRAAMKQAELAEKQYADWQENYAPLLFEQTQQGIRIAGEQADQQSQMQDYQMGRARLMDTRWDQVQVPLEDRIIGDAYAYNEDAERERMARLAGEGVGAAFQGAQGRIQRGLAARGVRAGSAAATAAMGGLEMQRALAEAQAINQTRQAAKDIGWSKLGEAAALGRGLPGFGATSAQLSMGAGQAALGAGQSGVGLIGQAGQANNQAAATAGANYAGSAGALNTQYGSQISAFKANQSQGSPLLGIAGTIAGSFFGPMGAAVGKAAGDALAGNGK